MNKYSLLRWSACLLTGALLAACGNNDDDGMPMMPDPPAPEAPNLIFYALTDNNRLALYNARSLGTPTATLDVSGLASGDRLLSIDFRPATGELYGISQNSRLYAINPGSGAARTLREAPFEPNISGDVAYLDFNPTVDRIRLMTNQGQNLRLNPETGAVVATDGNVNGISNGAIITGAYTNSFSGATATELFNIDLTTRSLYRQNPPNDGTQETIGELGIMFDGVGGFDISPDNAAALAILSVGTQASLYTIDISTGRAAKLNDFPASQRLIDIAIPTNPVAYAVDAENNFHTFDPTAPTNLITRPLQGLGSGERLLGIDFRPAKGQLYAISSNSTLYTINLANGMATAAVDQPIMPGLMGEAAGFDFNPVPDRLRIVTTTGQNYRINVETGEAIMDGAVNPDTFTISGSAYENNFAGTTSTTLFNIDAATNQLTRQVPPNDGTQVLVGNLGVDVTANNGFDIGGVSNEAYAILTVGGQTAIYEINLTTGAATRLADFPRAVTGMSLGLGL